MPLHHSPLPTTTSTESLQLFRFINQTLPLGALEATSGVHCSPIKEACYGPILLTGSKSPTTQNLWCNIGQDTHVCFGCGVASRKCRQCLEKWSCQPLIFCARRWLLARPPLLKFAGDTAAHGARVLFSHLPSPSLLRTSHLSLSLSLSARR